MGAHLPPAEIAYQMSHLNENKGTTVVAVCSVLFALDVLIVCARFFARRTLKLAQGWDDWLIVPGLVMIGCMLVELTYAVKFGLGRHALATDPAQGYKILMIGFFLSLTYTLSHWFIKMSIMFFYIRIFGLWQRWFQVGLYFTMAYVTGWALSMIGFILGQCQPLDYFWQRQNISLQTPATGNCPVNTKSSSISTSVLNTVADFMILALPIFHLVRLQLTPAKKVALLSVFLVGTFTCIASIVRVYYTSLVLGDITDVTYDAADGYLWTFIEASIGLLCACFPIVGPLFKILRTKVSSKASQSQNSRAYNTAASNKVSTIGGQVSKYPKARHLDSGFEALSEEELQILGSDERQKTASIV